MPERREIEGVLRNMKSESSECICCDGPHIFGYGIDIEPRPSIYPGLVVGSVAQWIDEELSPWRDRDGMKVRVILEFDEGDCTCVGGSWCAVHGPVGEGAL